MKMRFDFLMIMFVLRYFNIIYVSPKQKFGINLKQMKKSFKFTAKSMFRRREHLKQLL